MPSKISKQIRTFGLAVVAGGLLVASGGVATAQCGGCTKDGAVMASDVAVRDVVDTAVSAGSFKTLVTAVKAAGLAGALKGEGPFTVFAPTDEAFGRLPEGTLASLLKPENKARLQAILTYHVVPGKVMARDVVKLSAARSLNGQQVSIRAGDDGVRVDGARVVKTDVKCTNGVIHVIDQVILPSSDNLVQTAARADAFRTLVAAVKAAGLVEALSGEGPFTVLAPTNAAFAKLPDGTLDSLLQPENQAKLQAILKLHVIPGRVYAADALKAGHAATLEGGEIVFKVEKDQVLANGAKVIRTDLDAANGVIHVIDSVILPQ